MTAATAGAAIFRISFATISGRLIPIRTTTGKAPIQKGDYVTGLVTSVQPTFAYIKIGPTAPCSRRRISRGPRTNRPSEILKPGDLVTVQIKELNGTAAEVELEQVPVGAGGAHRH